MQEPNAMFEPQTPDIRSDKSSAIGSCSHFHIEVHCVVILFLLNSILGTDIKELKHSHKHLSDPTPYTHFNRDFLSHFYFYLTVHSFSNIINFILNFIFFFSSSQQGLFLQPCVSVSLATIIITHITF